MIREDILDLLRKNRKDLENKYHVSALGLFGSYLREDQTEESDLDILDAISKVHKFIGDMDFSAFSQDEKLPLPSFVPWR